MVVSLRVFNKELYPVIIAILLLNQGCALFTAAPDRIIEEGYYEVRYPALTEEKVYVKETEDTVVVYIFDENHPEELINTIFLPTEAPVENYTAISFKRSSFDLDLLSFLFKYRPSQDDLPRQLNSELSGVLFAGYRRDIYTVDYISALPGTMRQEISHTGFSFGIFSGFGSTFMNPWVTSQAINSEYDGVVWIKGMAALLATPNINIAMGIGFDYLLDGNKGHWIYQHKPWLGFAVGLDLN
jgi:hypothetical protein